MALALHPVVQKILESAQATGRPALSAGTPDQARAQVAAMRTPLGPGPKEVNMMNLWVPTRSGKIPARLYKPEKSPKGLVVYLHGGGWVCGQLDDFDALSRKLAKESGCAILLVDYRLAPEHTFPSALHDVEDAIVWAHGKGMEYFEHKLPLIVAGDSAGANLGIAAIQALNKKISIALQVWFYPVTDSDMNRPSYQRYSKGMPLTCEDMRWFFSHYAPSEIWSDARISILNSSTLKDSPSTWVATAEYDVLRDEGEAYANQLKVLGVNIELHRANGLTHGFARLFNIVDTACELVEKAAAAMSNACETKTSGN
jgi:acetyl esterase